MLGAWVREASKVQMGDSAPAGSDRIGDVLAEWYEYEDAFRPKLGYERRSSSCNFQISRQWDESDHDDRVDDDLLAARARAVAECIEKLDTRFRVAIQTEMHNRNVGRSVYRNPRNPETQAADFNAALAILAPMLAARGLIEKKIADKKKHA